MPKVIFPQVNKSFEVPEGFTILEVALNNDIDLEHNCGGNCACSTCHVVVQDGYENLSPKTEEEQDMLNEAEGLTKTSRLSCQSKIQGDIAVVIPTSSNPLNNPDIAEIERLLKEKEQKLAQAGVLKSQSSRS
jgi:2Fe-2S ferredoxin